MEMGSLAEGIVTKAARVDGHWSVGCQPTMKVVLVVYADIPNSAPGRRVHMLARGLVKIGHEAKLLAPMNFCGRELHTLYEGIDVAWGISATIGDLKGIRKRVLSRLALLKVLRTEVRKGWKTVLFSNPNADSIPLLVESRRLNAFTIGTYDDARKLRETPKLIDRAVHLTGVVADWITPRLTNLNAFTSSHLMTRLYGAHRPRNWLLFPPIVDTEQFAFSHAKRLLKRSELGLKSEALIVYTGTFWKVEGVRKLLEAAAILKARTAHFRLLVCGKAHEGFECDNVQKLVDDMGLTDLAILPGWVSKDDVISYLCAGDIMVVPKIDDVANLAGMPAKLAEYMAVSRAVVASKVGDIPNYLSHKKDCLFCTPGDAEDLASALDSLISDPELRDRLGSEARRTAEKHFACEAIAADFVRSATERRYTPTGHAI